MNDAAAIVLEIRWPAVGWEIAQLAGLLAALGCLVLTALPVRPRARTPQPLPLRRHEALGWLILLIALLHAALLPAVDRSAIEHLRLTMPRYEWAGIGALALLLVLTLPATAALRRRIWTPHRNFQALHVAIACLLIVSVAVHVITTDRYLHGRMRHLLYLGLSAAALLALLRRRPPSGHAAPVAATRLVFGRHTPWVAAIVVTALAALPALLASAVALALREPVSARTQPLAIDFPHEKHQAVACVTCHHNFTDRRGDGGCIGCHRSDRADLRVGAEARFHDFCLGCHRDPPPPLTRHGPLTRCDACHLPRARLVVRCLPKQSRVS